MSKPFKIVCSELDQEFQVRTERDEFVGLAPTAKNHSLAKWDNKKIPPRDLWESISTECERKSITELLAEPGLTKDDARRRLSELQVAFFSTSGKRRRAPSAPELDGQSL